MTNKTILTLLEILLLIGILLLIMFVEYNYNRKEYNLQTIIEKCYYQSQSREELDFCINKERNKEGLNFYERISY